ncbi:uncharacterized protein LY89DRAFT_490184 [Mollisia scopiformis]|uniref:Uncharacterized protein n=1 Tax=Mollisia scopiformis TaxID=149040 RepID=A0A194XGT8_MOLSC|nr:uncharacterized protein LY89DRAFT_490184 [Mollisia scopiformis]KUJ19415.1 hypothetical protein LY89DRAFT_490184 [Mollisia scopiformis]
MQCNGHVLYKASMQNRQQKNALILFAQVCNLPAPSTLLAVIIRDFYHFLEMLNGLGIILRRLHSGGVMSLQITSKLLQSFEYEHLEKHQICSQVLTLIYISRVPFIYYKIPLFCVELRHFHNFGVRGFVPSYYDTFHNLNSFR